MNRLLLACKRTRSRVLVIKALERHLSHRGSVWLNGKIPPLTGLEVSMDDASDPHLLVTGVTPASFSLTEQPEVWGSAWTQ